MIRPMASLWLACLCSFAPLTATAQEGPALTWGRALERALASSPLLASRRSESLAAEARAEREALPAAFTLGAELENVAGSGVLQGVDSAEATLRVGHTLELGGKRAARTALGLAEAARAANRSEVAEREVASLTRLRFVELLADQRRLAVAQDHVTLASRSRDEVAATVRSARNPETDLHAAELALADAELELEHAEHELAAARVTLASSWGAREADFGQALGSLDALPDVETLESLTARLDASPASRDAHLAAEIAVARRELARANRKPDLSTSVGVRRLEGLGEQALVMSVSVPLGSGRRGSLELREAQALESARGSDVVALLNEQHRTLFEEYQEMMHARTEFELLRDRMLPAAEKSLALAQRGFDAGRFPFLTLSQAQEKLIELRRRQIDAAVRHFSMLAEIELLAGPSAGVNP